MKDDDHSTSAKLDHASTAERPEPRFSQRHKSSIILLSSTVLMLTWKYFGSAEFCADCLADQANKDKLESISAIYQFASCLVLLGLIPALIIKLVFGERLADYGVRLGNRQRTIRSMTIMLPLILVGSYFGSMDASVREAFPINRQAGLATPFWLHVGTYILFYVGWEFHFRGFLQFGLSDSMGRSGALLIQVMASSLLHIGQPFLETIGAVGAGALWGWAAYRTNSIASGLIQHLVLGVAIDAWIIFG